VNAGSAAEPQYANPQSYPSIRPLTGGGQQNIRTFRPLFHVPAILLTIRLIRLKFRYTPSGYPNGVCSVADNRGVL
jgi:hypothetical protein